MRTPIRRCTTPCTCSTAPWSASTSTRRPPRPSRFSEFNVGLDHVSFGCADRAALEGWQRRLDELGIEHGGIKDAAYGSGISFRDPDNIPLEFFCPPG